MAAVTPQKFDQDWSEDGCLKPTARVTISITAAWTTQIPATASAVRYVGSSFCVIERVFVCDSRGKKMTKRVSIAKKLSSCVATCRIPRSPAKHDSPLTFLQHATSCRLCRCDTMFAKEKVPEVVPNNTKYGDIPKELFSVAIRINCGR